VKSCANNGTMGESEKLFQQPSDPSNDLLRRSSVPDQIIPTHLVCRVCHKSKPLVEMSKDRCRRLGCSAICNPCMRNAQNTRRAKNVDQCRRKERERRAASKQKKYAYDERGRARKKVLAAINSGKIVKPSYCSRCLMPTESYRLHAHHADYSKPLEIVWICSICHGIEHRRGKPNAEEPHA
jgi:hypothetical protein